MADDLEHERIARITAEEARDALARALKPFALLADRPDLISAVVASLEKDELTFELPTWFEKLCGRARYAMYAKAPEMMNEPTTAPATAQ